MHVSSSHLKEVLKHEQGVQRMDLKKTKKNNATFGVQQTNWYKRVSVTQSSRYRSIYIDWQRSYDE